MVLPAGRGAGPRPPWSARGTPLLLALVLALVPPGMARAAGRGAATGADLTGDWVLNVALSQPSPLPRPRVGAAAAGQAGGSLADGPVAPEDSVLPDPPVGAEAGGARPVRRRPPSWLYRPERLEALRVILGDSRALSIVQGPRYVDLRTEAGSRSLEPGVESQVSLPTGELADQQVRWQGRRLVVERRVPRGQKVIETYELLSATDQLRVGVRRSGSADDGLGRIEWLRVYDRDGNEVDGGRSTATAAPAATATPVATSPTGVRR